VRAEADDTDRDGDGEGTAPGAVSFEREWWRRHLHWWRELLYIAVFYGIYSLIRNQFGSAAVGETHAFHNAEWVIDVERAVGLYHEETLQEWFLPYDWFMRFWNIYYGSLHFIVTAGVLIWLFRRFPQRYALWRNTLACTTALALFGYALFPLMPPRLLPASFGYVDTLAEVGGLWSFDSGAMQDLSNQYAAMPSMHFGWSLWCCLVMYPHLRRWWTKAVMVLYPVATTFGIMVTANHYWLDALGGAIALGIGFLLGRLITLWASRRLRPSHTRPVGLLTNE
jgi:hypothetical protein